MWSKKDAVRLRERNRVRFRDNRGLQPMKGEEISKILEIIQKPVDLNGASEPNTFTVPAHKTTRAPLFERVQKSLDSHPASEYRAI